MEKRYMQMQNVTTRSDDNGDKYLEGIFVAYDSIYNVYPGATESIARGAFTESINGDVRALYNHNSDIVLGRTSAGTLVLRDTDEGLWGRIKINPQDSDAMNAYARIKRGDLSGCSFGFDIPEGGEEVSYKENGDVHFTIKKVNPLLEVSPCVFPAYEATHISARRKDMEEALKRQRDAWKEKAKAKLKGE
jgi:HK97 family phage prohead protease